LEVQPTRTTKFCESTPFLISSCDLICTHTYVVLITHKEVLARIAPSNIVYYIMLDEPMSMQCAMDKIAEISA
jgi:hypothetical protein